MTNELFDYNLEQSVLSSIIFEPSLDISNISADIFNHPILKQVFHAIQQLNKQNLPIDENIIRNHLVNTVKIPKNNVEDILINIMSSTPTSNIKAYVSQLEEYRKKRDIKNTVLKLNQDLNENKTANELETALLSYTEKIVAKTSTELLNLIPASVIEEKEADFITKDFIPIPKKTVTIFSAGGGTGKTSLLLQLAMRYLHENPDKKAFCWLSEDPLGLTKHRLNSVINGLYKEGRETLHRLILAEDMTFPVLIEHNRTIIVNSLFYKIKMMLKDFNLIILDPLIAFFGGDENNNAHAKLFMQLFTKWASEEDKTIIFIHHSTKNTTQSRGASAFVDASRAVYEIDKVKDDDGEIVDSHERVVKLTKDNYRASKYFGGFTKKIAVFPRETKPILVTEDKKNNYNVDMPFINVDLDEIEDEYGIS